MRYCSLVLTQLTQRSNNAAALRQPYIRVVHLETMSAAGAGAGSNPFGLQFSPEEEEEFGEMARSENFYERFAKSVGPSIYGSLGTFAYLFSPHAPIEVARRYQEGYNVFAVRWLEKGSSGRYAFARRYQRAVVG